MKTRNGFVSNSSSSSFILAIPKESAKDKVQFKIEGDLTKYADETLKTKKDVIAYFKDDLCCNEDDENFIKALEAIDKGFVVIVGSLSDESDDPIQVALCFAEEKDISITTKGVYFIQKEAGY